MQQQTSKSKPNHEKIFMLCQFTAIWHKNAEKEDKSWWAATAHDNEWQLWWSHQWQDEHEQQQAASSPTDEGFASNGNTHCHKLGMGRWICAYFMICSASSDTCVTLMAWRLASIKFILFYRHTIYLVLSMSNLDKTGWYNVPAQLWGTAIIMIMHLIYHAPWWKHPNQWQHPEN